MTYTEKKSLPLGVGDSVKHYDDGKDGHPEKWVNGVVTEIGDESFSVLWDDFKKLGWETEYEWEKVEINGSQIFETGQRSSLKQQKKPFRQPNRFDLMSNAEKAITLAMYVIEGAGASEMLTNAGIKLSQARDLVYEHYRNEGW